MRRGGFQYYYLPQRRSAAIGGATGASRLLGAEADGVALDFTDLSATVKHTATPANNFAGDVNSWLTYTSPSTKWIRNSAGLLVSGTTLRTEYDAALSPLGVRIEPAATNLLLRSQTFETGWVLSRIHAFGSGSVADAITAPDGTLTADKLVEDTGSGTHRAYQNCTITAGSVVTVSAWFKAAERTYVQIRVVSDGEANVAKCIFNLSAGTAAAGVSVGTGVFISSSIEAWGNGWYRCSVTATVDPSATIMNPMLNIINAAPTDTYVGDGVSGLYVWGAQAEVGRWPSSYIPTTTATVTRVKDDVLKLITAMPYSATAGTLFAEFSTASPDITSGATTWWGVTFDDAGASNAIGLQRYNATLGGGIRLAGAFQADMRRAGVIATGFEMHRTAIAWAANDAQSSTDGVLTASDASVTLPTVTRLDMSLGGGSQTGGHMKRLLYVPRRVSNGDLPTFGGTS